MNGLFRVSDLWFPFFAPDGESSGGGEGGESGETGGESGEKKPPESKTFTQDEVDRIVRTRLTREKDSIRTAVLDQLRKDQETEDAKKRGDYEKVIAEKDDEIRRLSGSQKTIEEFEELANARFNAAKKTLPETILALAPDDDASPLEKERWWTKKALPALEKWEKEAGKTTKRGVNDGNDPNPSKADKEKYLQDLRTQLESSGKDNF